MTQVDVVVVAYCSRDTLHACVSPLLDADDIHVIVVDNASPDRSGDAVDGLPLTLVRASANRGFGAGCNEGWRVGRSPYVLFLNPDAEIEADAVRVLVEALEQDPAIGAAGPRLVDAGGRVDRSIRRFPGLRSTLGQALFLHRFGGESWADEVVRDEAAYRFSHDVDWLSGACLMLRRSTVEALDGFDEGFFMYCEDTDLCRRVWDLGQRVRYVAEAEARHAGGGSMPRGALLPTLAASRVRYARRHRSRRAADLERLAVALGELTHAVAGRGSRAARSGHLAAAARALRA